MKKKIATVVFKVLMFIIILVASLAISAIGIVFLIISCVDCGAYQRGDRQIPHMPEIPCSDFYIPSAINVVMIIIGVIGVASTVLFLIHKNRPRGSQNEEN